MKKLMTFKGIAGMFVAYCILYYSCIGLFHLSIAAFHGMNYLAAYELHQIKAIESRMR